MENDFLLQWYEENAPQMNEIMEELDASLSELAEELEGKQAEAATIRP